MTPEELQQWLDQNGGPSLNYNGERTIDAPNPAYAPYLEDGSANPRYVRGSPQHIRVPIQTWTNPQSKQTLSVYQDPSTGTYQKVESGVRGGTQGSTAANPGAVSQTQAAQAAQAQEDQRQREKNLAETDINETNAQRRAREQKEAADARANQAKPMTTRPNPADPTKLQQFNPQANNGQGAWEDAGAIAQKPTPAPGGLPLKPVEGPQGKRWMQWNPATGAYDQDAGPVQPGQKFGPSVRDAQGRLVQPSVDPDTGQITGIQEVPGSTREPPKPLMAGGKAYRPTADEQGNVTSYDEIPLVERPLPKEVPPWQPPYGSIPQDVIKAVNDRNNELQALEQRGIITHDQHVKIFAPEYATAQALVNDFTGRRSAGATERTQDINLTTARAREAGNIFTSPLTQAAFKAGLSMLPGHGDVAAKGLMAILQLGHDYLAQNGGLANIPAAGSYTAGQGATGLNVGGAGLAGAGAPAGGTVGGGGPAPVGAAPGAPGSAGNPIGMQLPAGAIGPTVGPGSPSSAGGVLLPVQGGGSAISPIPPGVTIPAMTSTPSNPDFGGAMPAGATIVQGAPGPENVSSLSYPGGAPMAGASPVMPMTAPPAVGVPAMQQVGNPVEEFMAQVGLA